MSVAFAGLPSDRPGDASDAEGLSPESAASDVGDSRVGAPDDALAGIPVSLLERGVRAVLERESVADAEISLTLLDDAAIRDLNRRYLDRDRPTDVIAFPLFEPGEPVVGDVYVGVEQARRQVAELGISEEEELLRLALHGTLHVLGYDHPEDERRESSEMYRIQEKLLGRVMRQRSREDRPPEDRNRDAAVGDGSSEAGP